MDDFPAIGLFIVQPVLIRSGVVDQWRQRHYQPPFRRILKILNFSSLLLVGASGRPSADSSRCTTASFAVPLLRVLLMRLLAAPSKRSHSCINTTSWDGNDWMLSMRDVRFAFSRHCDSTGKRF